MIVSLEKGFAILRRIGDGVEEYCCDGSAMNSITVGDHQVTVGKIIQWQCFQIFNKDTKEKHITAKVKKIRTVIRDKNMMIVEFRCLYGYEYRLEIGRGF